MRWSRQSFRWSVLYLLAIFLGLRTLPSPAEAPSGVASRNGHHHVDDDGNHNYQDRDQPSPSVDTHGSWKTCQVATVRIGS